MVGLEGRAPFSLQTQGKPALGQAVEGLFFFFLCPRPRGETDGVILSTLFSFFFRRRWLGLNAGWEGNKRKRPRFFVFSSLQQKRRLGCFFFFLFFPLFFGGVWCSPPSTGNKNALRGGVPLSPPLPPPFLFWSFLGAPKNSQRTMPPLPLFPFFSFFPPPPRHVHCPVKRTRGESSEELTVSASSPLPLFFLFFLPLSVLL